MNSMHFFQYLILPEFSVINRKEQNNMETQDNIIQAVENDSRNNFNWFNEHSIIVFEISLLLVYYQKFQF